MDKKKLVRGPMTWVLLFLLVLWGTYLLFGQSNSRAIDTSDGLTLLAGETVQKVEITEGLQRVKLQLSEDYLTEGKGGAEENLGTEVEFFYVAPQGPEVVEAVKAAAPEDGYNSVVPQTSFLTSLLSFMLPLFLLLALFWRRIKRGYLRFEQRFFTNLNEKDASTVVTTGNYRAKFLHMAKMTVSADSPLVGRCFRDFPEHALACGAAYCAALFTTIEDIDHETPYSCRRSAGGLLHAWRERQDLQMDQRQRHSHAGHPFAEQRAGQRRARGGV